MTASGYAQHRRMAAVIGDVVSSRRQPDRAAVQAQLVQALDSVNETVPAIQPLDVTLGDEFQGAYENVSDALLAALLVRLELLPIIETRYGVGWGEYVMFDPHRQLLSQDGPAWWGAREAIIYVKGQGARARSRHLRTWFFDRSGESWGPNGEGQAHAAVHGQTSNPAGCGPALNAFLVCRDERVGRMNERSIRLLRGLMHGKTQVAMGEVEGITQSAVSQQLARSGAYAVREAHAALGGRDL